MESAEKEGKEKKEMEEGRYGNGRMEERDILPTKSTLNSVKCVQNLQAGMTKRKTPAQILNFFPSSYTFEIHLRHIFRGSI